MFCGQAKEVRDYDGNEFVSSGCKKKAGLPGNTFFSLFQVALGERNKRAFKEKQQEEEENILFMRYEPFVRNKQKNGKEKPALRGEKTFILVQFKENRTSIIEPNNLITRNNLIRKYI